MSENNYFFVALTQNSFDRLGHKIVEFPIVYLLEVGDQTQWEHTKFNRGVIQDMKESGYDTIFTGELPENGEFYGIRKRLTAYVAGIRLNTIYEPISKDLEKMIQEEGLKVINTGLLPDTSSSYYLS